MFFFTSAAMNVSTVSLAHLGAMPEWQHDTASHTHVQLYHYFRAAAQLLVPHPVHTDT